MHKQQGHEENHKVNHRKSNSDGKQPNQFLTAILAQIETVDLKQENRRANVLALYSKN
jgi:hypothetical protein